MWVREGGKDSLSLFCNFGREGAWDKESTVTACGRVLRLGLGRLTDCMHADNNLHTQTTDTGLPEMLGQEKKPRGIAVCFGTQNYTFAEMSCF